MKEGEVILIARREMKRLVCFLCLVLAMAMPLCAQQRHAVVVGIGDYPENSGWKKIHGDADIEIVCAMLSENGFEPQDIKVLKNREADKAAIAKVFADLAADVQSGDWVYVHFSGHGQQVSDWDGDEADGWDEAIIPYDACREYKAGVYEGENHIIDDELNQWLMPIADKIGQEGCLLVVLDACHSGDGTRAEDEEEDTVRETDIRGAADKFEYAGFVPDLALPKPLRKTNWIALSACKPYQSNYEYWDGSRYVGRLTYALAQHFRLGVPVRDLLNDIEITYDTLPLRRNTVQNLNVDIPERMRDKLIFK